MTEKERIDTFLSSFKELEKTLIILSGLQDDYVSFSRALNVIYKEKSNPLISKRENYEFLKTASEIRNLLSHQNETIVPSSEFLTRFLNITDHILNPLSCYQACSKKIETCKYTDSLYLTLAKMDELSLSHLPILDEKGVLQGVFSRSVFFDCLIYDKTLKLSDDMTLLSFKERTSIHEHLNEDFLFVKRNDTVNKAFDLLLKKNAHEKTIALLFVTENGKENEKILGVLSLTDCARLSKDNLI